MTLDQEIDALKTMNANLTHVGELMRESTAELKRRQDLIDHYRRKNAEHEELIGKLYAMARNKEARDELLLWDEFCDLVTDAYRAIHGPSD